MVLLQSSLSPSHYSLREQKHTPPECHQLPWGQRPKPWTNSQLSSAPGPSPPFTAFQMLCLDPAPALQRRIVGSTLCPSACAHKKQRACVLERQHFPRLPSFRPPMCWDKVVKRWEAWAPRDTCSTVLKGGKSVALRFWSQSHTGCGCESKTMFSKVSMIRLSTQTLFMEGRATWVKS